MFFLYSKDRAHWKYFKLVFVSRRQFFFDILVVVVFFWQKRIKHIKMIYSVLFWTALLAPLSNIRTGDSINRWKQHKEKHQENNITRYIPYINHRLNSIRYSMYVIWVLAEYSICTRSKWIRMNEKIMRCTWYRTSTRYDALLTQDWWVGFQWWISIGVKSPEHTCFTAASIINNS